MSGATVRAVALLDVNVLVALFDPDHIHHDVAHDWFSEDSGAGWATCPLTENGFVRTANAARRLTFLSMPDLIEHLQTFRSSGHHHFWRDDISVVDERVFDRRSVQGRSQLTDIYLLGLAVTHEGRLVTFDRRIPADAVKGARPENLVVLAHSD